jgi:hypothetical protein
MLIGLIRDSPGRDVEDGRQVQKSVRHRQAAPGLKMAVCTSYGTVRRSAVI